MVSICMLFYLRTPKGSNNVFPVGWAHAGTGRMGCDSHDGFSVVFPDDPSKMELVPGNRAVCSHSRRKGGERGKKKERKRARMEKRKDARDQEMAVDALSR